MPSADSKQVLGIGCTKANSLCLDRDNSTGSNSRRITYSLALVLASLALLAWLGHGAVSGRPYRVKVPFIPTAAGRSNSISTSTGRSSSSSSSSSRGPDRKTADPPTCSKSGLQLPAPELVPMSSVKPPCLVRPLVLLTGDSLTQYSFDPDGGWGAALAHHFQRKADVINRGLSGYNTRWALEPFEQVMRQVKGQPVALLTIWFGANDAAIPGRGAERQHVPVPEYSANLASMVLKAREAGISNILLVTPPPVHDAGRVKHQQMKMGISTPVPPDRTLEHSQQYAAAVKEVGQQLHVPVVDMHSALQQTPNWQTELLADGLHFTPAGARAVWAALQPAINDNFSQLSLDSLSFQFPLWDKLDHANIEEYWQKTLPELQGAEAVQEAL